MHLWPIGAIAAASQVAARTAGTSSAGGHQTAPARSAPPRGYVRDARQTNLCVGVARIQ